LVSVVVDEARDARQLDSWRRIRDIAYKVLMESLECTRDVMDLLGRGKFQFGNRPVFALPFEATLHSRVAQVLPGAPHERIERMEALMGDKEWLDASYGAIRITKEQARRVLGEWSAAIVELPRHTDRFDDAALIADALEELQRPFHPVHRTPGGVAPGDKRLYAAQLCDEIITTAVTIEEALWHEMGRPGWKSRARIHLLSDRGLTRLTNRSRRGTSSLAALCKLVRDQYESSFDVLQESGKGAEGGG
jgi:hypothetical protein